MKSKLQLISFTGADDHSSFEEIHSVNENSPIEIEWALLVYPEMEGTPRNPTLKLQEKFLNSKLRTAAHICGEEVFRKILIQDKPTICHLQRYKRVQVNINARKTIFNHEQVFQIYKILTNAGIPLILQYYPETASLIEQYLINNKSDTKSHTVLFDASKGLGLAPNQWSHPIGSFCGYAGGHNPQTIGIAYDKIEYMFSDAKYQNHHYWLDMETGIRNNNQFCIKKCQEILDILKHKMQVNKY